MPAKLERCVDTLLKRKNFKPGVKHETRKSSAYAICTASIGRSHCDVLETLVNLPEDITFDIDNEGNILLTECEDPLSSNIEQSEEEAKYDLYFGEEKDNYFSFNEIKLAKDEEDEEEYSLIEMLREGSFKHPRFGDVNINRKLFIKLIQNYINNVLDREISFDLNHNPDTGAYAWLKKLYIRRRSFKDKKARNVLVGSASFTEEGKELVKNKKYKYFSIEYHPNFIDKENESIEYGPVVFGGALTNRPFIPSMKPITMSEDNTTTVNDGKPAVIDSTNSDTSVVSSFIDTAPVAEDKKEDIKTENKEKTENNEVKNAELNKDKISMQEKRPRPVDSELPNAAFALIKRDAGGNVVKRSLPHHWKKVRLATENSSVDVGRLRNALARFNQVDGFSAEEMARAKTHLIRHAKALLPSYKKEAMSEKGETMNFSEIDARITVLTDEFNAVEDKDSPIAHQFKSEIEFLTNMKKEFDSSKAKIEEKFSSEITTKLTERDKQIETLRTSNESIALKLAEIEERNRQLEVNKYVDELAKNGHAPAVVKAVRTVLMGETKRADDGSIVKFEEVVDGKPVTVKFSLREAIRHIVDSIPDTHKTDLSVSIVHNEKDEPVGEVKTEGKIKCADGSEVDLFDVKSISERVKKVGYKPRAN